MFAYYLDLAWRSLKRTLVLTGLMVLAIGLGIGASMTMLTVLHVMTADPLPGRSAHLYKPYVDPLPLKFTTDPLGTDPRNNLTWPDSMALLHARRAVRTIPGVESAVAVSYSLPLDRDQSSYTTCPTREALDRVIAAISVKGTGCLQPSVFDGSPRLVKTLGLRLVAGRDFRSDEYVSGDDPPAAIIPQIRAQYFERDRTMIGLLIASALGLLFVTALGIAGLANFWVGQRTCSIGIRRAVGATRVDILRYFLTENFVIVTGGVVLGAILAVGLNLLLMQHHELPRLPLWYLAVGAIALWFLGQLSVLATRSV
ncbi:MAG: ABC transporter permease [Rhodanobacteraceae bacterium]